MWVAKLIAFRRERAGWTESERGSVDEGWLKADLRGPGNHVSGRKRAARGLVVDEIELVTVIWRARIE